MKRILTNRPGREQPFVESYQLPTYWDERTPMVKGRSFARVLNLYMNLNDDRLRKELAAEKGFKLDAGCGPGRLLDHASVGVDFSEGMLRRAQSAGKHLIRASVTALPFRDRAFDFAYSVDVLPHLDPGARTALLSEVQRVSSRGAVYWARMSYFRLPHRGRARAVAALFLSFYLDRLRLLD